MLFKNFDYQPIMQLFSHNFDTEDAKVKALAPMKIPMILIYMCNYLIWLDKNFTNDLITRNIYGLLSYQHKNDVISY